MHDATLVDSAGRQLVSPQQRTCEHERGLRQHLLGMCAGGGRGSRPAHPTRPVSRQNLVDTPCPFLSIPCAVPGFDACTNLRHVPAHWLPRGRLNTLLASLLWCPDMYRPVALSHTLHAAVFPAVRACAPGRYQDDLLPPYTENSQFQSWLSSIVMPFSCMIRKV